MIDPLLGLFEKRWVCCMQVVISPTNSKPITFYSVSDWIDSYYEFVRKSFLEILDEAVNP